MTRYMITPCHRRHGSPAGIVHRPTSTQSCGPTQPCQLTNQQFPVLQLQPHCATGSACPETPQQTRLSKHYHNICTCQGTQCLPWMYVCPLSPRMVGDTGSQASRRHPEVYRTLWHLLALLFTGLQLPPAAAHKQLQQTGLTQWAPTTCLAGPSHSLAACCRCCHGWTPPPSLC
jgi:hypothetical protein